MNSNSVGAGILKDPYYARIISILLDFEAKKVIPTDDEIWCELHEQKLTKLGVERVRYRITHTWRGSKNCKAKIFLIRQPKGKARRISVDWSGLAEELWGRHVQTTRRFKVNYSRDIKKSKALQADDARIIGSILQKRARKDKSVFKVTTLDDFFDDFLHAFALARELNKEDVENPVWRNLKGIQRLSGKAFTQLLECAPPLSAWIDEEPF